MKARRVCVAGVRDVDAQSVPSILPPSKRHDPLLKDDEDTVAIAKSRRDCILMNF